MQGLRVSGCGLHGLVPVAGNMKNTRIPDEQTILFAGNYNQILFPRRRWCYHQRPAILQPASKFSKMSRAGTSGLG